MMGARCYTGRRMRHLNGVTPLYSCIAYLAVGMSVSGIYSLGILVSRVFGDSFGMISGFSDPCYHTRQLIIVFAILGTVFSLLFGLGGRVACVVEQWVLCICYFVAATYVHSHRLELHSRSMSLLRLAAVAAAISGMAQTSAVYCMTDSSMVGGHRYLGMRATSFFVGCVMSGLNFTSFFVAKQSIRYDNSPVDIMHITTNPAFDITVLCFMAGTISLIAAAMSSYMLIITEDLTCVDRACWFPFFTVSRCTLSASSVLAQTSNLCIPLLWTSNPLFVVFAVAVTLNSDTSFKLLFSQYAVYVLCAVGPMFIFGGGGGGGSNHVLSIIEGCDLDDYNGGGDGPHPSLQHQVSKTQDIGVSSYYEMMEEVMMMMMPNVSDYVAANVVVVAEEGKGATNLRPVSHLPEKCLMSTRANGRSQWSLLKGDMWTEWQRRDTTYRLCSESLSTLYSTLVNMQCLRKTEFYDNLQEIMDQYRDQICCSGRFIDLPFTVDMSWHPMILLREIIKHQRNVLLIQIQRAGTDYARMLKAKVKTTCCNVLERFNTMSLCCTSILKPVIKSYGSCVDQELVSGCRCCFPSSQSSVRLFLGRSVDAVSSRCESLIRSLSQHKGFTQQISNAELHNLEVEKRLICCLLTHCESAILVVNVLLLVEELLLLQEWLCLLCKYTVYIHEQVNIIGSCNCQYSTGVCSGGGDDDEKEQKECVWYCLKLLVLKICSMLIILHQQKLELLHRIRGMSVRAPDEITGHMLNNDTPKLTELIDTIRALVIIVLAIVDLLRFEGWYRKKENGTCVRRNVMTSSNRCIGAHHVLLPSIQYLFELMKLMLSLEESCNVDIVEDLVVWYAGLVNTLSKLCPEMEFDSRYSYESMMKMDEEIVIETAEHNIIQNNLKLAADVSAISNTQVAVELTSLGIRSMEYKSLYGTTDNGNVVSNDDNSTENPSYNSSDTYSVSPTTERCTSSEVSSRRRRPLCNSTGISEIICGVMENVKGALVCVEQKAECSSCVTNLQAQLQACKGDLEKLCSSGTTPVPCTDECCCKQEADVARFAKLVKSLTDTFTNNEDVCECIDGEDPKCGCANDQLILGGGRQIPATTLNILRSFFCCKLCGDATEQSIVGCAVLKVLCRVYKELCGGPSLQEVCKAGCCQEATTTEVCKCIKDIQSELCPDAPNSVCRYLQCWCRWFRCYVLCGPDCCNNDDDAKCMKVCSNSKCTCTLEKPGHCNECHLSRLSTSLFFCKTCGSSEDNTKLEECVAVTSSCSCTGSCRCTSDIKLKKGSGKVIKPECCSHRLGCAIEIITQDMDAFKHNACVLKDHADKVANTACVVTKEVKNLNMCLTDVYALLEYARCGINHMGDGDGDDHHRLQGFKAVSTKIECEFPCFGDTIKKIADKDAAMIYKMSSLLSSCLALAYSKLLLVQRVIWTCATVGIQCLRLKHLNTDLSHLKSDLNSNWQELFRLKDGNASSSSSAHGGMCAAADLGFLSGVRRAVLGIKPGRGTHDTFKALLEPHMNISIITCLAYIWIRLWLLVCLRYFNWLGIYQVAGGSRLLVTVLTALSAVHLTMVVRSVHFQSVASRSGGGKTGTYINVAILLGLVVIFVISWISNFVYTYSGMLKSFKHMAQRLRNIGIYDGATPKWNQLFMQTFVETFTTDVRGIVSLCRLGPAKEPPDVLLGFQRNISLSKAADLGGPIISNGLGKELSVSEFLSKMKESRFITLNWVLDALSFAYLYPEYIKMLNRISGTSSNGRNVDIGMSLLWSAWSTHTHITDSVMLVCRLCKEALLNLNLEYLKRASADNVDMLKKVNLLSVWSAFYEIQYKGIAEHCVSYKKTVPIYTHSQKGFLRDEFARWYVSQWDQYHLGLWEFAKKFCQGTSGSENGGLITSLGIRDPEESLKWLGETNLSHACLRRYTHSFAINATLKTGEYNASDVMMTDSPRVYEDMDLRVMLDVGRSWAQEKRVFCSTMKDAEVVCMEAVESIMSKLREFVESGSHSGNHVERFYEYSQQTPMGSTSEEHKWAYMKQPNVSRFFDKQAEVMASLLSSSVQPDVIAGGYKNIPDKYRREIKQLLELEENDGRWWRVLYWLGTWTIFDPAPISQGHRMRYLL